jgi:hypothetical protein
LQVALFVFHRVDFICGQIKLPLLDSVVGTATAPVLSFPRDEL